MKRKRIIEALRDKPVVSRRINYFLCTTPGCKTKLAQSKRKGVAVEGRCRKCVRSRVHENQVQLPFMPALDTSDMSQEEINKLTTVKV